MLSICPIVGKGDAWAHWSTEVYHVICILKITMSYVERLSLQNHIKIMTQINLATSCFYKALFHSCDRIEIMLLTVLVLVIFAPPWCQNMSPSQRLFCNKEENVCSNLLPCQQCLQCIFITTTLITCK